MNSIRAQLVSADGLTMDLVLKGPRPPQYYHTAIYRRLKHFGIREDLLVQEDISRPTVFRRTYELWVIDEKKVVYREVVE